MRRIGQIGRHLQALDDTLALNTYKLTGGGQVFCVSTPGSDRARPKINQDSFAYSSKRNVVCLCDGHGSKGEKASGMVSSALCKDEDKDEETDLERIQTVQIKIAQELGALSLHCGCSAVWAKLEGNDLVVSNVGDSRCVVVGQAPHNELLFETRDHKPDDPIELERIHKLGGRVLQYRGDVPRVCGLALSRAFGDFITKGVVSPEPDVTRIPSAMVKMCILATDGVFDMCTSQEVVDILSQGKEEDLSKRVVDVVRLCQLRWAEESRGQYADDVTLAVWRL